MSEPMSPEQDPVEIRSSDKPPVLESVGTEGGRITMQRRPDGDFNVTKTGNTDARNNAFIDFKIATRVLPLFREALPPLTELYPESPKSVNNSVEEHLILPGEERTDAFRKNWLQPLGANTAPIVYLKGDEFKKELITEQTAEGNEIVAQGDKDAEWPVHDRIFHLFGALAEPEELFRPLQYLAQQIPDLAKKHPEAANTVRRAIAQSLDQATNIVDIPGASLTLPSLDVLNTLVRYTETYSDPYNDSTGTLPSDFVRSVLKERGFDVVRSGEELKFIRESLASGEALSFVNHVSLQNPARLVVPKEHELLVDYVPKLVRHLQEAA